MLSFDDKPIWEREGLTIYEFRSAPMAEKRKIVIRHLGFAIWPECATCGAIIEFKKWANPPNGSWLLTRHNEHMASHAAAGERKCNCATFGFAANQ